MLAVAPVTFTGEMIVFRTSHDHKRANSCWILPLRSKTEAMREIVPKTMVYAQIRGARMK
jgi:hypothetical protein